MNKGRRQELVRLKYEKRIKKWFQNEHHYIDREGNDVQHPKPIDIIKDRGHLIYKTAATPCSCWMCQGESYDRAKEKREAQKIIQDELGGVSGEGIDEKINLGKA